ncbi:exodeoxyribonuclease [Bacteroidia bacterium]|nr:exodeoxyribonuclease [Bacteroidia bacterium]
MKLISYNLNGIRSAMGKGLVDWLAGADADVVCFQELKACEEQIDVAAFKALGYEHCYWFAAQKRGYSGTAILSKTKPQQVSCGMGIPEYDNEGRLITAQYKDFTLINSYFPSGTTGEIRQAFKMQYFDDFRKFLSPLLQQQTKILVTGDFNICHKPIDINHPERHNNVSGFLPEERAWMDTFEALGFVDTFRLFCAQPANYTWWSYRAGARQKNMGWRIDYFWATENLKPNIKSANIYPNAVHSDHCPVSVEVG